MVNVFKTSPDADWLAVKEASVSVDRAIIWYVVASYAASQNRPIVSLNALERIERKILDFCPEEGYIGFDEYGLIIDDFGRVAVVRQHEHIEDRETSLRELLESNYPGCLDGSGDSRVRPIDFRRKQHVVNSNGSFWGRLFGGKRGAS